LKIGLKQLWIFNILALFTDPSTHKYYSYTLVVYFILHHFSLIHGINLHSCTLDYTSQTLQSKNEYPSTKIFIHLHDYTYINEIKISNCKRAGKITWYTLLIISRLSSKIKLMIYQHIYIYLVHNMYNSMQFYFS